MKYAPRMLRHSSYKKYQLPIMSVSRSFCLIQGSIALDGAILLFVSYLVRIGLSCVVYNSLL